MSDFDLSQAEKEMAEAEASERRLAETERALSKAGWPQPLIKAVSDSFDYALQLRNGMVIYFESAAPDEADGWVLLKGIRSQYPEGGSEGVSTYRPELVPVFERGVAVRLVDIVWVADAPWGS